MNSPDRAASIPVIPNGSGVAALLAAGIGSFALVVLALAADKLAPIKRILNFYPPTGPLSGVTTTAILVWILAWSILKWRWRDRTVPAGNISAAALVLLILSLILTFPPAADLF
ncbi:MAG: hypothetical protein ABSE51_17220 [Terracidiphilus sp.]|jgi:hypothetical protein